MSWTEEIKKARRGDHVVRLFDEEGFAAVRKAQRSGADVASIPALAEITVSHPGSFNGNEDFLFSFVLCSTIFTGLYMYFSRSGPYVNSEILAAGLSILVAYVALSTKSKLLS